MFRAARAILQALQMVGVIAAFPAIEGLRTYAKVAAGEAGILAMGMVIVKPFKSLLGLFR